MHKANTTVVLFQIRGRREFKIKALIKLEIKRDVKQRKKEGTCIIYLFNVVLSLLLWLITDAKDSANFVGVSGKAFCIFLRYATFISRKRII